ncbi:V-type ATP synthase subunit E [Candidatus Micrarchaeota archaeon]|nr:V-type ATP synthase subunit E [Candidatus Micrarchaeota archaeon]
MEIEKLKGSLLSEANQDAQRIKNEAKENAKNMLEEERARISSQKKEAESDVERLLAEEKNERFAWARLESKRILAEAKEDAIKNVIEDIFKDFGTVRKTAEYRKFVEKACDEVVSELGSKITIHVVKGDKALVKAKGPKIAEDLDSLGGLIAETTDGKIRMDMTLETLFENRRDDIRKSISDKIFGGK